MANLPSQAETLRFPAAVVQRLLKTALPAEANISKEARIAFGRAAAVFILNMSTHANEYAISRKRKVITAEDVFHALKTLECEKIENPLKEALELWKAAKVQKAEEAKRKKSEKTLENSAGNITNTEEHVANVQEEEMNLTNGEAHDIEDM